MTVTVYSVHSAIQSAQCTVYTAQCTIDPKIDPRATLFPCRCTASLRLHLIDLIAAHCSAHLTPPSLPDRAMRRPPPCPVIPAPRLPSLPKKSRTPELGKVCFMRHTNIRRYNFQKLPTGKPQFYYETLQNYCLLFFPWQMLLILIFKEFLGAFVGSFNLFSKLWRNEDHADGHAPNYYYHIMSTLPRFQAS